MRHLISALRAALGRLDAALADCNESLRLRPDSSNTLDFRAFVYIMLGRWDDALAVSDAALQLNPRNAWAFYERGLVKRRKGDMAGGDSERNQLRIPRTRAPKPGRDAEVDYCLSVGAQNSGLCK